MKKYNTKGLTLVEVLVAAFILVVGILSVFLFFTNAMKATQYAQDLTLATSHAENVLEEMKIKSTLAEITGENWTTWAQSQGFNTLPSESTSVSYPAGDSADPLDIQVTVSWTRDGRSNNIVLRTHMTK